ncbi:MAG: hypothetical protein JXB49_20130 [Bacteroidales bacterium]|nr:hypothetical protein [Bacteroidales bacterium]
MGKIFIISRTIFNRKIQRLSFTACIILLIAVLLNFPQYITAQIRPKMNQPIISAKQKNLINRKFNLRGSNREIVEFEITNTGAIEVKAEWSGTARELALILNGPGRVQYYARNDGQSPLTLTYNVPADILSLGKMWKISVVNFGSSTIAQGNVQVTYPQITTTDKSSKSLVVAGKKPVIKPVEESKSLQIKHYEVLESKGLSAKQLQEIKGELEAKKIEDTRAKIENRIKESGPDNPMVQIVVPLIYKSIEEHIQKPLMKNGINTSPYLSSLIQSYKKITPLVAADYFHPRYAKLRTGQRIDKLQLGQDILEAINPSYKSEIRRMVSNSISIDGPKFQWNAAGIQRPGPQKVEGIQVKPSQKQIINLKTLTERLEANPTQNNYNELKESAQAQGFDLTDPYNNYIQDVIAKEINLPDLSKWIPNLNNDHLINNYYKYDIGLDWFYCMDQNERTCIWLPFVGWVCSDDEPYWHLSSTVPNYDPNDPDQIHNLYEGKLYSVHSTVTSTYDDVNNGETRVFRTQDHWLLNNNIYNTSTSFTVGLWEEDWSKEDVRNAIHEAINDLREDLSSTIKEAVMDAIKDALFESFLEALPDELHGVLQLFFEGKISFSSFMESVQTVMGGVDIGMIAMQLIFSGESITEIISGLGGACPEITAVLLAIKVAGPIVIDLFEGDFQDAFKGLLYLPLTLFEFIWDLFTDFVHFFENLMAIIDPDDLIQNRSITIEGSFDNIFEDAPWGDYYSNYNKLVPSGCGPKSSNSSLIKEERYVQPSLLFMGADAEYHAYYNVKRTLVGGRETFGYTTRVSPDPTYMQTRTYKVKSRTRAKKIKVSYCTLNNNGTPLIFLYGKGATGTNLNTSNNEFYVDIIPGAEYELKIINIHNKDLYGYVTIEEK